MCAVTRGVACVYMPTRVKAVMIEGAAEVIALADHDKLGTAMAAVVAPIGAITTLVTDSDASEATLAPYRAAGIDVLWA